MAFFESFLRAWRFCPVCEQGDEPLDWLCLSCLSELYERLEMGQRDLSFGVEHHYLFSWRPGDLFLSRVAMSLKGGRSHEGFRWLALWFYTHLHFQPQKLAYPSPGPWDHSQALAKALAQELKASVVTTPLYKAQPWVRQRRGSRQARRGLSMKKTQNDNSQAVVIVDDILTTGETARACFEALGRPQFCQVWTLFHRKLL